MIHNLRSDQLSPFFNRLGEMRDRTFENQRYRASGLNLSPDRTRLRSGGCFVPWDETRK